MMDDARSLYQEMILDHGKRPRNFAPLVDATHRLDGFNPLCGDQLTLYLKVLDGKIVDAAFTGKGCAISMASASLMTQAVKNRSVEEAEQLFSDFHKLVTVGESTADGEARLGKLLALTNVRQFPARVKCATLAWHTLDQSLHGSRQAVSTE